VKKLLALDNRVVIGAAIGFTVAAVFFVASQQHHASEKYKAHHEEYCAAVEHTAEQNKACEEEGASARDYLPWGYILVSWPEGITTWAIIFTGFAIVWQSWETRRAAEVARNGVILQFRPRVRIRSVRVFLSDDSSRFQSRLVIRNGGETTAHILKNSYIEFAWMTGDEVTGIIQEEKITPFDLAPGATETLQFTLKEAFYIELAIVRELLQRQPDVEQADFLCCSGTIYYADDIGTRRETTISRIYSFKRKGFVINDAEAEYSD
jgi:hypothetical protein